MSKKVLRSLDGHRLYGPEKDPRTIYAQPEQKNLRVCSNKTCRGIYDIVEGETNLAWQQNVRNGDGTEMFPVEGLCQMCKKEDL